MDNKNTSFWMAPPFFDVYLYDLNDVLVATWTEGRAFAAYIEKITLKPGENCSKTFQWDLYSYNHETGGFIPRARRISGVWRGEPRIETSKIGMTVEGAPSEVTKFKAVVNGMRDVTVFVHVDISNGLAEKEAELLAEATFIEVMGERVMHRLDTLTFDDTQIKAHCTWGVDENDMGHVFDFTADLTTLLITVTHCR